MKKKPAECKSVDLPMSDDKKEMITRWKNIDKDLSPLKCTQNGEGFMLGTISRKGSDQDKNDLIHAGVCLATGAKASIFGTMLLNSCVNAGGFNFDKMEKKEAERIFDAILDALHSLKPNDEIEGMLVTRLIALHFQIHKYMIFLSSLGLTVEQVDSCINRSAKLTRLYNETLETLMRYRRKGEQKFLVQHVNVNEGGRAIVGNLETGGGGNKNSGGTP
jgi:hypothetical protein